MALVTSGAPLNLELRKPIFSSNAVDEDAVNVFFRFVDGKTLCLLVNPHFDDVGSIKERLLVASQQSYNFLARDLFLVCNGKPLDDDGYLAEYNVVREGATVMVSYRNRGGCFMVSFSILMIILAALIGSTCTCGLSLVVIPFLMPLLFVLPFFCL